MVLLPLTWFCSKCTPSARQCVFHILLALVTIQAGDHHSHFTQENYTSKRAADLRFPPDDFEHKVHALLSSFFFSAGD